MLLKTIASIIVLIVYALLPDDFFGWGKFAIILLLWNVIVYLPGLFIAALLKGKVQDVPTHNNTLQAKDKTRFEEWCDFRLKDIGSNPDIQGIKPTDVAKGLAHLIACDHMYQMRHNEQYWQKCINQLRDAHGDPSARTANMLFMVYDEASDEMQHSKEEKEIVKNRLAQANTKVDKLFWLAIDHMEDSPELPNNMEAYILKCSSL